MWPVISEAEPAICLGDQGQAEDGLRRPPPDVAAAAITGALQSVVSRNVTSDAAVLSVTCLQAGNAYNVIPETAQIRGTARTFKRETMALMEANIKRLATSVAAGFCATAEVDFRVLFAPPVNDAAETHIYADAAAALAGRRMSAATARG